MQPTVVVENQHCCNFAEGESFYTVVMRDVTRRHRALSLL